MSDYGVTDKGFQMRRLDEIYTDICKRFKDEVGVDPSENPQSVMNVLFTIFADLLFDCNRFGAGGLQN